MNTGDEEAEIDLEVEVEVELKIAEAARADEELARPVSEWLFDPAEEKGYEIELRSLLGAVFEEKRSHRPPTPEEPRQ